MAHDERMNVTSLPKILPDILPKILEDAYTMFDSLDLSVTSLVVIGLLLTIVFLFAAREAASWFFKIDDIKKDVKKVSQLIVEMEAEVRMLQGLLGQNMKLAGTPAESPDRAELVKLPAEEKPQPRFTLTH